MRATTTATQPTDIFEATPALNTLHTTMPSHSHADTPAAERRSYAHFTNIPQELCERRQWVAWKPVQRGEKTTKVPVTPRGYAASTTDPRSWSAFDELTGPRIGFVFTADDPYCGVDIDACRNPATGSINGHALSIMASLGSYTEVSPSGTGLHVICRATLGRGRRTGAVEIYDRARYFCMTGQVITPTRIEERQAVIDRLVADVGKEKTGRAGFVIETPHPPCLFSATPAGDADLLAVLRRDGNFEGFYTCGALSYARPDYSRLLSWCARLVARHTADVGQIERIVRQTALYGDAERARRKWDTRRGDTTWGRQLIADVVGRCA